VLAYAFGLVDWSYESALMLESLNTIDILRNVDWKMFILRYGYHFVKSGLFPIGIIFVAIILTFIRKNKNGKNSNFDFSSKYGQLVLMASYGFFAVVPFTLVRGFTYRLEAAFVFLVIPALFWFISNSTKKQTRIVTSIFLLGMLYQHIVFWHAFNVNKKTVTAIAHGITTTIPVSVLKKEPERILCCVDFYNPYNKYRLCNPMVFAGWGVRFIPFIESFGYLNMNKPFTSELYSSAKYICLPSSSSYFPIDSKLEKQNRQLLKDKDILILEK
jgi:hypothetical protein